MFLKRFVLTGLLGGLALGVGACTDGYGYTGASVGYGSPGYYDGYYGDPVGYGGFNDPYGYGYGGFGNYYGWYNNFYYPGTGVYVYDRYRRPHRWTGAQQRYWQGRRGPGWNDRDVRQNWRDFGRDVRQERRDYRGDVRDNRQAFRNGEITREQLREGRRDARREYRSDVRQDFRDLRRQNRAEGVRTPRPNRAFNPRGGRRPR